MAGRKSVYVCNQCGYESVKWNGRCPSCGEWNTLEETEIVKAPSVKGKSSYSAVKTMKISPIKEISTDDDFRYKTGMTELDRVLGGGIVKGSIVLLGGDPGIGKSTLLLQMCEYIGKENNVLYISGEESARQIKLRADRLGVATDNLYIAAGTDAEAAADAIVSQGCDIAIIDSIQTMSISSISSSPGSITQVRECTNLFMRTAKENGISIFIVGHVNKDGAIAGPKVMEHIVDTVLYFEGDRQLSYRMLRAVKNRYGSTNEIGVFQMNDDGLQQVENPSQMLLTGRPSGVSGSCVVCSMEGTRPILAEVQALVTKSGFGTPRRMAASFDYNRLALILAVMEKRCGFYFGNLDVYVNVVGGLRLTEPAADLAVACALYSGLCDKPVGDRVMVFGEIGLGGEIRNVNHFSQRINEGARLGFERSIVPKSMLRQLKKAPEGMQILGASNLKQAFSALSKE